MSRNQKAGMHLVQKFELNKSSDNKAILCMSVGIVTTHVVKKPTL